MNHAAVSPAQKRLDAIRNRVELASKRWGITANGEAMQLLAGEDGTELIASIGNSANFSDRELVLNAPDDLIWLVDVYEKLASRYRVLAQAEARRQPPKRESKDYAAECAMKCGQRAFIVYLMECHALESDDDKRVAIRVRSILSIKSRGDLNKDPAAAARWRDLVKAFDAWRQR